MIEMGTGSILRDIDYPDDCKVDIQQCCDAGGYIQICLSKQSCKYQKVLSNTEKETLSICMK